MIRNTTIEDLDEILKIYEHARKFMAENGNPDQWGKNSPSLEMILDDIEKKNGYVVVENNKIEGVFAYILGEDPTYKQIDGKWLNDEPYGTIHRIASIGKGVFHKAIDFAFTLSKNVRIDTHENNIPMQNAIKKEGFTYCGIIICHNGTPRIAFQKSID